MLKFTHKLNVALDGGSTRWKRMIGDLNQIDFFFRERPLDINTTLYLISFVNSNHFSVFLVLL